MLYQISSGIGSPVECQFAVSKIFDALRREFPEIKTDTNAPRRGRTVYLSSIIFSSEKELPIPNGTIEWICQSPMRPNHKRKNWFVTFTRLPDPKELESSKDFKVETFRSGGKGGQNVNKTETGVRITHIPTGLSVVCTEERSQYMNKIRAHERMEGLLHNRQEEAKAEHKNQAWRAHSKLERGNPVRVYRGLEFKLDEGAGHKF